MNTLAAITFVPLVPWWLIAALAVAATPLLAWGLFRRARGILLRALALTLALLGLANPLVVEEERQALSDVAAVIIDESPSTALGERREQLERAAEELRAKLERQPNLDVRVVRAGRPGARAGELPADDGSRMFDAINRALADTPRQRVAGAIILSDGQVHDVPASDAARQIGGPVHGLLAGRRDERDRRIVIEQAPTYGLVGQEAQIVLRVEDPGFGGDANVAVRIDGQARGNERVAIGGNHTYRLKIEHGGPIFVELEVEGAPQELTLLNNRTVVALNGVRDRLRVLLISGEPHAGERVWRNLLKADPSVDLVHFTILRPPEKQDGTPIRELSLIAFPIRELFEIKLNEFDLVIFDRYRRRGILPNNYFQNIANYVRNGGALLEASGPAFAGPMSLSRTPLMDVLPGRPTGQNRLEGYKPEISELGRRHPVTADLPGAGAVDGRPDWGRWFQLTELQPQRGNTVMQAFGNRPVLQLDRVGQGRVAQFASDQAWLWARGFEGGGPQAELLRRMAHWLMKEPDLEEEALVARAQGGRISIERRSLQAGQREVTLTRPDGTTETVTLGESTSGRAIATYAAPMAGMYRLADGDKQAVVAIGAVNPREFSDVRASEALLRPVAATTGGAVRWLVEDGVPDIRRTQPGRDATGRGWMGLQAHNEYLVTGVRQFTLLPALALLILLLGSLAWAWRREGR